MLYYGRHKLYLGDWSHPTNNNFRAKSSHKQYIILENLSIKKYHNSLVISTIFFCYIRIIGCTDFSWATEPAQHTWICKLGTRISSINNCATKCSLLVTKEMSTILVCSQISKIWLYVCCMFWCEMCDTFWVYFLYIFSTSCCSTVETWNYILEGIG
jgi:hypothetical protein